MAAMQRVVHRMGILPTLVLSFALTALGILAANRLMNTRWPFDVQQVELVRATAQQRVDAAMLLAAADNEVLIAFLACVVVAMTGLALPFAYILNRRFGPGRLTGEPPSMMVTLRVALWFGLWSAFCVWLQMNRTLGIAVAALAAAVLILFELLLQIRAHASTVQQEQLTQQ